MDNRFGLNNKNVVVTGATGILGQYFCKGLLESGAKLALIDRSQHDLETFKKNLMQEFKSKIEIYPTDITQPEQVNQTVQSIVADFGNIDVLHNNAASKGSRLSNFLKSFEDYDLSTWKEVMDVNVNGLFLMAQAVGKEMIKFKKGGSIIQTGSIYGLVAPDKRIYEGSFYNGEPISSPAVYSASKAAVIGLTQYLAAYWGEHQIRVNTLTPGGVESGQNSTFSTKYSYRVPLNRMAKPDDLLGALIFLASDSSQYITGQNIVVDGGLSVW